MYVHIQGVLVENPKLPGQCFDISNQYCRFYFLDFDISGDFTRHGNYSDGRHYCHFEAQ